MLRVDFLAHYGATTTGFAKKLGVYRQTVNELLSGCRAVSPAMTLRLSRLFANTPKFY
jgi:addiction module HigA family antidote